MGQLSSCSPLALVRDEKTLATIPGKAATSGNPSESIHLGRFSPSRPSSQVKAVANEPVPLHPGSATVHAGGASISCPHEREREREREREVTQPGELASCCRRLVKMVKSFLQQQSSGSPGPQPFSVTTSSSPASRSKGQPSSSPPPLPPQQLLIDSRPDSKTGRSEACSANAGTSRDLWWNRRRRRGISPRQQLSSATGELKLISQWVMSFPPQTNSGRDRPRKKDPKYMQCCRDRASMLRSPRGVVNPPRSPS